jgi:hypothetical protein
LRIAILVSLEMALRLVDQRLCAAKLVGRPFDRAGRLRRTDGLPRITHLLHGRPGTRGDDQQQAGEHEVFHLTF